MQNTPGHYARMMKEEEDFKKTLSLHELVALRILYKAKLRYFAKMYEDNRDIQSDLLHEGNTVAAFEAADRQSHAEDEIMVYEQKLDILNEQIKANIANLLSE